MRQGRVTDASTVGPRRDVSGGVGESAPRPDAVPKVTGRFAFLSDLAVEGMAWGATRRATVAHARITRLDVAPALAMSGVFAVLTQADVPGHPFQGQIVADQPVLADREIRHWGEAVAIVAAKDEETARRAAESIDVDYEILDPLVDLEDALAAGEVFRHVRVRHGDPDLHGEVAVDGYYETSTVDQAALGTEAGLAVPDGAVGVDIWGPTQWTHVDRRQIAACLGLDEDRVRIHIGGLGGAFGSREDLSLQTHLAMLALRIGRPVKMVYDRTESFAAHVKRHAARMWYRHEADTDGTLIRVEARLLLDGGAYHMTSEAVIANATSFAAGPYRCPTTVIDGYAVRTNNPPAGAMRGFGANQPCFAYESQMDKLAAALDIDPVQIRLRNLLATGDRLSTTGQLIAEPFPAAEALRTVAALPLPARETSDDPRMPGGGGSTTRFTDVVGGIGYAVGFKNLGFSEGFDDYAEARVELTADGAVVHTAAIEAGQGLVTVLTQIARSALGVERVQVVFDDTSKIGSAGSSSASRQTQMAGGAVLEACREVLQRALGRVQGADDLTDEGLWRQGELVLPWSELTSGEPISEWTRFRHPSTEPGDGDGQGTIHADFSVAAHRAVVDVDPELGLVRVVRVDTAQDVGHAINPQQVIGQIEGGIAQGLGMAIMEELMLERGVVRNPNFTDYLLPTILDTPDVEAVLIEEPGSWGPFGAKGMGELPAISSTPAIVAAIRAASGRDLHRLPVRPDDIVGLAP